MKRTILINLICSLITVLVIMVGVFFVVTINDEGAFSKPRLVINSESSTAVYNGKPLTNTKWHVSDGELKEGHKLSVNVSGVQTDVGISENHIYAQVLDAAGKDVSEQYNIQCLPGTLNVKSRSITITASSGMKRYDGEALESDGYRLSSPMSLIEGHTLHVTVSGSITEIGETDNLITRVAVTNVNGHDVTRNYNIKTEPGKLVVYSPDALVIESDGGAKMYDGLPLYEYDWKIVNGELLDGDTISVEMTGSQTDVGFSDNYFNVTITNYLGNDVTSTYEIIKQYGQLVVVEGEIIVTSNDNQKQYDGTPLTDSGYIISPANAENENVIIVVNVTGSQTEVGSSENTIESCTVFNRSGTDISSNYKITLVPGTLSVVESAEQLKEELKIVSFGDEKVYDGTPLTNSGWTLESGEIAEGHILEVVVNGEQTNKGSSDNTFDVVIRKEDGTDVTSEYIIEKQMGTLEVFPMEIEVQALSKEKKYDGEPLTCDEYCVTPSHAAENFTFEVGIQGSITEIGEVPNAISYITVYNSEGIDVTSNFDITKKNGYLRVTDAPKTELTYTSGTSSKVYDGTPLTDLFYERIVGQLNEGDREVIEMTASITEVGSIDNTITVTIYNSNDEDVTSDYIITFEVGTLTVTKRSLTVESASDSKVYDGTPLTNDGYSITGGDGLVDGHMIDVGVVGSRTSVGTAKNDISYVKIYSDGEDVTKFYNIDLSLGNLVVEENEEQGGEGSGGEGSGGEGSGAEGSGSNGSLTGSGQMPTGEVWFIVTADSTSKMYLKTTSYGDYDKEKRTFLAAAEYAEMISANYSAYYTVPYALYNSGVSTSTVIIESKKNTFVLPYYTYPGSFAQSSDTHMEGDASSPYTVSYYAWNGTSGAILPSAYKSYESEYAQFVKENYLNIDPETKAFMDGIIEENNFSSTDVGIIKKVASYIKNAADYNMTYDERMDQSDNMVVDFLSVYKEGVCRHYAAAATMLYRALGIPARYTEGFVADTKAGVAVDVTDAKAHAWVEVYIDGIGWVYVEVTGSSPVEEEEQTFVMTISPSTIREIYTDGKTLEAPNTVGGFSISSYGYTYVAEVSGYVDGLGSATSEIIEFEIYNKSGELVYKKSTGLGKEKFVIKYKTGLVQLYLSHLTFASDGAEKVYDGIALETLLSDCYMTGGNLYDERGYSYVITPTGQINTVGTQPATFSVNIYKNGVDCTSHFWITNTYGSLTLSAREITISAGSASKAYDGTALECNNITYDVALLAVGDTVSSFVVEGIQKNIGSSSNVLKSVTITDSAGKDVTGNYKITIQDGLLVITVPTN